MSSVNDPGFNAWLVAQKRAGLDVAYVPYDANLFAYLTANQIDGQAAGVAYGLITAAFVCGFIKWLDYEPRAGDSNIAPSSMV